MTEKAKLKYKMPKELGACIDLLAKVDAARSKMQQKADAEAAQYRLIEEKMLERFKKSVLEGAAGRRFSCSVERKDYPTIEDGAKLDKHVLKTGELDLFQRRLSVEACRARFNEGKKIPGVGIFTKVRLKLTKRK